MRIVFYATHPTQPIGYAKVAHKLANALAAEPDVELLYIATGNYPLPYENQRFIHPAIRFVDVIAEEAKRGIQDGYGVALIDEILRAYNPDRVIIYNDIVVQCRLINALLKFRAEFPAVRFISYLDLVYPFERADFVRHVDRNMDAILVFSDCWAKNLAAMGVRPEKIHVLPHGFSADLFDHLAEGLSQTEAKVRLGFAPDDFILFNTNRNTYRKAQDITLGAFLDFLIAEAFDPRLKLLLNCSAKTSSGYDIPETLEAECLKRGISPERAQAHIRGLRDAGNVSDEQITAAFVAADVGINTCTGEGFGLCNMEHAAFGRPQVVSGVGALVDIFGGHEDSILIPPKVTVRVSRTQDEHAGDVGFCDSRDFAAAFRRLWRNPDYRAWTGEHVGKRMRAEYAWEPILRRFCEICLAQI